MVMNIMNILFVLNNSVNYGGAERYVSNLSNALARKGDKVVVVSCTGPILKHLDSGIIHKKIDPSEGNKQDVMKIAQVIEDACKKYKINLIHCNSLTDFRASSIVKKITGIPLIHTAHLTEEGPEFPIIGAEFNKGVDKVIAVSNFINNHLQQTGLLESKIELIYHGVNSNEWNGRIPNKSLKYSLGIKEGERVVMCVARLYPIKGIHHVIEAVPIILEKGNNIKVVFVGDGAYRQEYKKLAEDIGVKNKVLFLGARDNIEELLSIADVFCLSSTNEALSFAILEAMAEGVPVVATKVGGIPEVVVNQVTGLLIPPGNIQGLANSINHLLEDKSMSKKLGANAKKRIEEHFRFDRMLGQTFATYERVLEEQRVFA